MWNGLTPPLAGGGGNGVDITLRTPSDFVLQRNNHGWILPENGRRSRLPVKDAVRGNWVYVGCCEIYSEFDKSQCDQSRPCQLCVRAGVTCIPRGRTSVTEPSRTANVRTDNSPAYEGKAVLPEQSIVELSTQVSFPLGSTMVCLMMIETWKFFPRDYPAYDTSALPGGKEMAEPVPSSAGPWQDAIGQSLPPREVLDSLVDQFFNSVNWFMMVVPFGSSALLRVLIIYPRFFTRSIFDNATTT